MLVDYKSISSVFDITSAFGTTTSLKTAENQLKKNASLNFCYYNTYLKQHELQYSAIGGDVKRPVNLRQCHLILMLDNLVRQRYVADPNPGENRSKQICTLPITLQGLPLDHSVTELWNLSECHTSANCLCKNQEKLQKEDVKGALLQLKPDEHRAQDKFSRLMAFGSNRL
ncbi:hypothetical protein DPMN_083145 [Dreissena polymorpha]|uniref:Uncharacterized protein n=1 Tax=Dreissena polymorpha TaxID=45954 RepID=A0A9D3YC36_DREPO|nr:hypothetical protein DPMN_083145 [Dreissena polymorpha]